MDCATQTYQLFVNGQEIEGASFTKAAGQYEKSEILQVLWRVLWRGRRAGMSGYGHDSRILPLFCFCPVRTLTYEPPQRAGWIMEMAMVDSAGQVISAFAWPATVFLIVLLFRRPLAARLKDIKSVHAPGIGVDLAVVEQIVKEGQAQNLDARQITQRIQQAVSNTHQLRILRALIGEDQGRFLIHYQDGDYKPAMEELIGKGLVRRGGPKFYLTDSGRAAVRAHLLPLLSVTETAK